MMTTSIKIIKPFIEHKKKILFMAIVFALFTFVFAYMKPNVYRASTDIEIGLTNISSGGLSEASIRSRKMDVDTEIKIIKSRKLIQKVLERGDFKERYYISSYLKEEELYNTAPFDVTLTKGEDLSFYVRSKSDDSYLLEVEGVDINTLEKWKISKIYRYGDLVKEKYFSFTLFLKEKQKLEKNLTYKFSIFSLPKLIKIAQNSISVWHDNTMSNIVTLNYIDTVPLRTQEFVNILAEVYLEYSAQRETIESSRILNFIDKQLDTINDNLQHSEQKLENFKKQSKIVNVEKKTESIETKLAEYRESFSALQDEEESIYTLYQQVVVGKNFTDISVVGLNLSSNGLPRLLKELQVSLKEKKRLRINYTLAHPTVRKLTQNISQTKDSIVNTIKNLKKRIVKRKKLLAKTIKEYTELLNTLPEKEKIFGGLQRKYIVNEEIYAYVLKKRASTAIAKASTVSPSRVIDTAVTPTIPIEPKRILIVSIGFLLGLFVGMIMAYLLNILNNRIKTEEDIRENSSLTLLGSIPYISETDNQIKVFTSPKSVISEAFRTLRTNLQFYSHDNKTMIISITSSIGGEGKSTVSVNLAAIMSLAGKKTIILNMDMRKPTLHQKFEIDNTIGMSNLLSGTATLNNVIQKTKHENIDVITSGPIPPNPSELIESGTNMFKIVEELETMYDVIILDTPPIGLVSDAMSLMRLSDITLYILRSEYSKKVFLSDISRLKEEQAIKGLTLVLNGVKTYKDGYGYYEEDK